MQFLQVIPFIRGQALSCPHSLLHRYYEFLLIHGVLKECISPGLDGAGLSHQGILSGHDNDGETTQKRVGFESLEECRSMPGDFILLGSRGGCV